MKLKLLLASAVLLSIGSAEAFWLGGPGIGIGFGGGWGRPYGYGRYYGSWGRPWGGYYW